MQQGKLWWLLIASILLPVSASVVEPNVPVDPNGLGPPAAPGTALIVQVLATLGSLYALARAIVWATPTPRDDAALGRVTGFVRGLARTMGLDPKQGVQEQAKKT